MGIVITVNGSSVGDGFLVAPDGGRNFSVPLNLKTDDGSTVNVTVDAAPNGAGVALPGGSISVGPAGTSIPIFATAASAARRDTVINVHAGAAVTSFSLTAISSPEIWFKGRFEVRFATDNDWYNDPKGTWGAGNDGSNPLGFGSQGPGYTFWLEGEPLFTPTGTDVHGVPLSVPTSTDKTGVGRVIRFNNPVAQRSHAAPVVTVVDGIRGTLSTAAQEYFTAGDPVINAAVSLGPDTYLAQNWEANPSDPPPAEFQMNGDTREPMALFEFQISGFFSGKSATDGDRPKSAGYTGWADDPNSPISTTAGIPSFATFNNQRLTDLQNEYAGLSASDQTGPIGRNLQRRIGAFTGAGGRPGSPQDAWEGQEEYKNGKVNDSILVLSNASSVINYFAGFSSFAYYNKLHTFHSDELCGYVYGSLNADQGARLVKTCSLQIQNSTFGKDQLNSIGLPASFPTAFWVALEGFFPSELGIDASDNLTNPPNPPVVTFSVDPSNANAAAIANALQTMGQLTIEPFNGPVFTTSLPPVNAPQRILYPFTIRFTGTDGFIDQDEFLTLTATITVNGKTYSGSAPLELTTAANPYVVNADPGNQYTTWLSTDLRVFKVDDDELFFGKKVSDFYGPGVSTSAAATGYIADLIQRLTTNNGTAGGQTFDNDLSELEDATRSQLEFLTVNPRSGKPAFNFAICRVRIRGTTPPNPPPPFTTQAQNCRVFFRAFQAQTTSSTFSPNTTYRSTPIVVPDVSTRVPLLGYETDAMGQDEFVTLPFFAVDRANLNGPVDLTTQSADAPNVQTISPITGQEVDTYYGCWLDINQPTALFPQFAKPGDYDNRTGYFNSSGFGIQSINAAFTRAPHQCLIAEVAFDDVPIPQNADSSTSDKLAQRNLAYIDGPNPGAIDSRRMPHPFQIQATKASATYVDEIMITWGNAPKGSTASIYLPGVSAADILSLADSLYPHHQLKAQDANTIRSPWGPVTFIPIPKNTGLLAGLLTIDLPTGVHRGDVYSLVVRQITTASRFQRGGSGNRPPAVRKGKAVVLGPSKKVALAQKASTKLLTWRRVLGAFQVNIPISTKEALLLPEEHRLALFKWIAENVLPQSRWYPVMQRYVSQLAGRVLGFGGNPSNIPPSPTGNVPGHPSGGGERHEYHEVTGKVSGLHFDHFGDFEGFSVETNLGEFHRFRSREKRVLEIVRSALDERSWVTVIREPHRHEEVLSLFVRRPPACHD